MLATVTFFYALVSEIVLPVPASEGYIRCIIHPDTHLEGIRKGELSHCGLQTGKRE